MKKEEEEKIYLVFFYLNKIWFLIPFVQSGLAPPIDFIIDPSFLLKKFSIRKKRKKDKRDLDKRSKYIPFSFNGSKGIWNLDFMVRNHGL